MKKSKGNIGVLNYFYSIVWRIKKTYVILLVIQGVLIGILPLIKSLLTRNLVDEMIYGKNLTIMVVNVSILILVNLIVGLFNSSVEQYFSRAHTEFDDYLKIQLCDKFQDLRYCDIESASTMEDLEKAQVGISWYSGGIKGLSDNLQALLASIVTLGSSIILIMQLSWLIVGLVVFFSVCNIIISILSTRRDIKFSKQLVALNRIIGYYMTMPQDYKYAKEFRIFNASDMVTSKINRYIDEEWKTHRKLSKNGNKMGVIIRVINCIQQAFLYGYIGLMVIKEAITIGYFTLYITIANNFSYAIVNVSENLLELGKNCDFMYEYLHFMEYESEQDSGSRPVSNGKHTIEFRNVSFRYPGHKNYVLRDINITIRDGESIAIVGPNGAGKTSFIKLLCRLYRPDEGEILLDGVNINEYSYEEYNRVTTQPLTNSIIHSSKN